MMLYKTEAGIQKMLTTTLSTIRCTIPLSNIPPVYPSLPNPSPWVNPAQGAAEAAEIRQGFLTKQMESILLFLPRFGYNHL